MAGDEEVGIMDFGVALEAKKGSVGIAVDVGFSVAELTNPDCFGFSRSAFHYLFPWFLVSQRAKRKRVKRKHQRKGGGGKEGYKSGG